ncbi:MAG: hypothetical protein VR73_06290 [Gammaproteobacteria bacterium BRH_c0]|nr:MAG: hypothetical protein VR73_06290 [Gammaproteobacteria bacterium BRH_c0]
MTHNRHHDLLAHAVYRDDSVVAITHGKQFLSVADLRHKSGQLALQLVTQGAQRAALQARNGCDWMIADLACQLAGIPLLPLPGFFSAGQLRHAMLQTAVDVVLTDNPQSLQNLGIEFSRAGLSDCTSLSVLTRSPSAPEALAETGCVPDGTGKITYTSGSTGAPKGVCLGNDQLIRQALALRDVVALTRPRHLCLLPLSVLLENVAGVYTCLLAGGEVRVPDLATIGLGGSSTLNIGALARAIDQHQPNSLILVPQLLSALVSACEQGWQPPASLQFIAVGGARVSARQILRARDYGLPVYEGYGLSECASVVSLNTPQRDRPGSAGQPLPHLEVHSDAGEITIAGNPFLGYVGEPDSWHQSKVRSGDLGTLDSAGFLHLSGRSKNLLISSFGRNISPEWVESELMASPLICDCIVFGDARPWLTALICPQPGIDDNAINHWISHCNQQLPDYARVQAWQRLAEPLAAVPDLLTATGKPRRAEIHHHFAAALETLYEKPAEVTL